MKNHTKDNQKSILIVFRNFEGFLPKILHNNRKKTETHKTIALNFGIFRIILKKENISIKFPL